MRENPFRYGQVVTGEYFTNREDEIREITGEILSGQSVILISPRRYGKTSVIMNAIGGLKLPYVAIDLQLITDEIDFSNTLVRKLLSLSRFENIKHLLKNLRVRPAIQFDPNSNEVSVAFTPESGNSSAYLEDALDMSRHIARRLKKRIVILFDEFQDVRRISGNLEKKMRSIFQHHQEVSYVFIGSQEHMIRDIFENKNNPFYKFGRQMSLREIKAETMKKFIMDRFARTGRDASRVAGLIVSITGGHPYYTQQLCHELFIVSDDKTLRETSVTESITGILTAHNNDYLKWWNDLDNTERKILIGMCDGLKNPTSGEFIAAVGIKSTSTAGSAVKRLLGRGILIRRNGDAHSLEDPFWMRWIIQHRK